MLALRRRHNLEKMIREILVPVPWDVNVFLSSVSQARGRQIHVVERRGGKDSVSGSVMVLEDDDIIFVRRDLRGSHRDHVICHEVGHLLAGHLEGDVPAADFGLPGAAARMLNRECGTTNVQEQEAELLAERILSKAIRNSSTGYNQVF